ncbi:MAG: Hsp33 family molecular chaperone HslO [Bradyrhizobiaceae bacterium]|nr:Hsp33 family molecular chaperone HslO [Bradyrhizobiaceae bacterium]
MDENLESIRKKWTERDRVVKAITKDGMFRAAVVHNTLSVQTAQNQHELDPLRSLMLARAMSGATLMASFLKGEERVVLSFEGDGQIRTVYAEAMQVGEVRGYCTMNEEPVADRKSALGQGLLKVQRVLYGKNEPITGIVELIRGDVTTDLGHYLTQSEQIPSAFMLDCAYDEADKIRQSVGLLVQAMPGARPEDIFKVYDVLDMLDRPTEFADRGYTPEDILRQILPTDIDVLGSSPVDFFCRCSIERFKSVLLTLGYDEILSMERQGHNELHCQYCNKRYLLTEQDFGELKEQLLAKRN